MTVAFFQKEQPKVWKSSQLLARCVTDLTEDRLLTAFLLSPIMRSVTLFQVAFACSSGALERRAEPKHKESGPNRWMFSCDSHITLCYFYSGFSLPWRWVAAVRGVFNNTFCPLKMEEATEVGDKKKQKKKTCLLLGSTAARLRSGGASSLLQGMGGSTGIRNNGKAERETGVRGGDH